MAFADLFKKKEKEVKPPPSSTALPVEQVRSLQEQGYPNDQIIEYLKSQGFSSAQIYDAIAQVEARTPAEPFSPPPEEPVAAPRQTVVPAENTEEIVESILQEKLRDFSKETAKVKDWQDHTDSRVDKLEQGVKDLRADVESLHKAIVSKISDYDKSLMDVGTEIKAMEKVFSKVLPDLTESVAKLSSISREAKKKKVKK